MKRESKKVVESKDQITLDEKDVKLAILRMVQSHHPDLKDAFSINDIDFEIRMDLIHSVKIVVKRREEVKPKN